jgi:hypothetical protein
MTKPVMGYHCLAKSPSYSPESYPTFLSQVLLSKEQKSLENHFDTEKFYQETKLIKTSGQRQNPAYLFRPG